MTEEKKAVEPTADSEIDQPKKWYRSTTIQAIVAAVIVLVVLPRLGIEVPKEYTTEIYAGLASAVIIGLRKASGSGLSL